SNICHAEQRIHVLKNNFFERRLFSLPSLIHQVYACLEKAPLNCWMNRCTFFLNNCTRLRRHFLLYTFHSSRKHRQNIFNLVCSYWIESSRKGCCQFKHSNCFVSVYQRCEQNVVYAGGNQRLL